MFLVKDKRLVFSASGRQKMEQLEYVFVLRKLLSRWNSPTGPVSRTRPASACWAERLGCTTPSFLARADCHCGHWGALPVRTVRMTAEAADGGG